MAEAASAFLGTLDRESARVASMPFEDEVARRDWHYIPRVRAGLSFAAMTSVQEKAAYDLLATALALPAFAAAVTVIAMEDVLDRIESGRGPRRGRPQSWGRHRGDYSTTVFGLPGTGASWGWRFEGHHLSVNVAIVDGHVTATPLFLGSNPAEVVAASGHAVIRPLAAEEDVFLGLLSVLEPRDRNRAFLGAAPDDILSGAATEVSSPLEPLGVPLADLGAEGAAMGEALVRVYVDRLAPDVAARKWQILGSRLGEVHLAWAGEAERGRPQYYRLQGPGLFVEYDNAQDGANHVHTVVRDPTDDFGVDLLRDHRARHHH